MVTRGWNGYRNKSQHRKSTLEKKILPPFQQGFEPATFQSRVRCSNHRAIPAPLCYPVIAPYIASVSLLCPLVLVHLLQFYYCFFLNYFYIFIYFLLIVQLYSCSLTYVCFSLTAAQSHSFSLSHYAYLALVVQLYSFH